MNIDGRSERHIAHGNMDNGKLCNSSDYIVVARAGTGMSFTNKFENVMKKAFMEGKQ